MKTEGLIDDENDDSDVDENKKEQEAYEEQFLNLESEVKDLAKFTDLQNVDDAFLAVQKLREAIDQAQEDTKLFQQREMIFDSEKEPTDYSLLGSFFSDPVLGLEGLHPVWMKTFEPTLLSTIC